MRVAVLRHGMGVSAAGLVVGLIAALSLRRLATPLLYGITPADPLTLVVVSAVLMLVGALATWLPARRAARLDPVRALRGE
jgi:ABC-type antimicrobial peptide transport system permease subunit